MSDSAQNEVALPAEFLQTALTDLKTSVDETAANGKKTTLNAHLVERFDGAALQFLMAFANSDISATPCVSNMSTPLASALKDIGVSAEYISSNFDIAAEPDVTSS